MDEWPSSFAMSSGVTIPKSESEESESEFESESESESMPFFGPLSTSAPFSSKSRAASMWPCSHATNSGV